MRSVPGPPTRHSGKTNGWPRAGCCECAPHSFVRSPSRRGTKPRKGHQYPRVRGPKVHGPPPFRQPQQETKTIAIRGDRVRARSSLCYESLDEKTLQQRSQLLRCFHWTPFHRRSRRSLAPPSIQVCCADIPRNRGTRPETSWPPHFSTFIRIAKEGGGAGIYASVSDGLAALLQTGFRSWPLAERGFLSPLAPSLSPQGEGNLPLCAGRSGPSPAATATGPLPSRCSLRHLPSPRPPAGIFLTLKDAALASDLFDGRRTRAAGAGVQVP